MQLLKWQWDKQANKKYDSYEQLGILIVVCKCDLPSRDAVKVLFINWFIHLFIHLIFTNHLPCARQCRFQGLFKSLFGFTVCFTLTFFTYSPKAKMMHEVKEWCAYFFYCVWFPKYPWLFTIRQSLQGLLVETLFWTLWLSTCTPRGISLFYEFQVKKGNVQKLYLVLLQTYTCTHMT